MIGLYKRFTDVTKENSLRATFDNFDCKMSANVILEDHKNSDFHWITHVLTFDGVSNAGLNDTTLLTNDRSIFSNF